MKLQRVLTNVNAAHLLRDHDDGRSKRSPSYPGNREQLYKTIRISSTACVLFFALGMGGMVDVAVAQHQFLQVHLGMDIVEISCCLKRRVTESSQRLERIVVSVFLDVPPRTFCIGGSVSIVVHQCALTDPDRSICR